MWAASGVLRPRDAGKATGEGTSLPRGRAQRLQWSLLWLLPALPGRCLRSTSSRPAPLPGLHLQGKAEGSPHTHIPRPSPVLGEQSCQDRESCLRVCMCHVVARKGGVWAPASVDIGVRVCTQLRARRKLSQDGSQSESTGAPGSTQPPRQGSWKTELLEAAVEQDGSQQPGCLRPPSLPSQPLSAVPAGAGVPPLHHHH